MQWEEDKFIFCVTYVLRFYQNYNYTMCALVTKFRKFRKIQKVQKIRENSKNENLQLCNFKMNICFYSGFRKHVYSSWKRNVTHEEQSLEQCLTETYAFRNYKRSSIKIKRRTTGVEESSNVHVSSLSSILRRLYKHVEKLTAK